MARAGRIAEQVLRHFCQNLPTMPTHSRYWLTETRGGKTRRYRSGWKMTAEEAAERGLTEADKVPGSEETRQGVRMQSAGLDGVKPGQPKP